MSSSSMSSLLSSSLAARIDSGPSLDDLMLVDVVVSGLELVVLFTTFVVVEFVETIAGHSFLNHFLN